jgi:hypothetical protein
MSTRIYSYGASEPIEGLEGPGGVREQLRDAHSYRNWFVELERERRAFVDEFVVRIVPDLGPVNAEIARLDAAIEAARAAVRQGNVQRRSRECPEDESQAIQALKRERAPLYGRQRELRRQGFDSAEWEGPQAEIQEWYTGEEKVRRELASQLIAWGTRGAIETAVKSTRRGAPPRFRSWRGDSKLAVQVQKGITSAEALACEDLRVRVEAHPEGVWVPGSRRPQKLGTAILWFRVGSEGRQPRWAKIPFWLHRPLPEDARVKWVYLIRRRIGLHDRWLVQFVVDLATERAKGLGTGTVSIDIGWRVRPGRRLRVAVWRGEDGREGELVLPKGWIDERKKCDDLRSIRDVAFNEAKAFLAASLGDTPTWLVEEARTFAQWRRPGRLARLVALWRDRGGPGNRVFSLLWNWRRRERHLYSYEANLSDQLQARRLDLYRCFAADTGKRYARVKLERMDLRDFHELPETEEPLEENADAKKAHVRDAALSILRRCLAEKIPCEGVDPADTTRTCAECGSVEEWDHAVLRHECSVCGAEWDQDENAAKNIASAPVVT